MRQRERLKATQAPDLLTNADISGGADGSTPAARPLKIKNWFGTDGGKIRPDRTRIPSSCCSVARTIADLAGAAPP